MSEMFKMIMTEFAEVKAQMKVMNEKLEQISKDTDGKINNLTNKVNKRNRSRQTPCGYHNTEI